MDQLREILESLNGPQRESVEHTPVGPLQILAGPGSGKTKVLTTRIAYLILVHKIPPWAICAVTFTNKAANEMRERLTKLIGKPSTKQLKMGTFHALCARFLRQHATLVGLSENFTILDADESEKLVGKIMKKEKYQELLQKSNCNLTKRDIYGKINKSKGKGLKPDGHVKSFIEYCNKKGGNMTEKTMPSSVKLTAMIWKEYEEENRKTNCVDFDDLLIFGVRLVEPVENREKVTRWCRHVLVDEYQDTNSLQYALMKHIAGAHDHVTIVGDPDQSIYGWRSADVTNIQNMKRDFPRTQQIYLEQNYRSTSSILAISHAIIAQDKTRIEKTLHTDHAQGPKPMLRWFHSEHAEALFIAAEIKRVMAASGGMLKWQDFVILLRYGALSRNIEAALQIEGIPNRMHKGHKFFDRAEIKDLLAYLQIVDNPLFLPAFMRTINTPPRTLGEKSVAQIVARAEKEKMSALAVCEAIVDGRLPDNKPGVKKKVAPYVKIIRELRKHAAAGMGPADLIRAVCELTDYYAYLEKNKDQADHRRENVEELLTFATQAQEGAETTELSNILDRDEGTNSEDGAQQRAQAQAARILKYAVQEKTPQVQPEVIEIDSDSDDDMPKTISVKTKGKQKAKDQGIAEAKPGEDDQPKLTPLREFLQNSMLATDTETDNGDDMNKVTMSTCHAAKGLEWPVVFVPGVETDIFPFTRAENFSEERRLLYVAATRAQGLLYMTHCGQRMINAKTEVHQLSRFVLFPLKDDKRLMSPEVPNLNADNRAVLATVLNRPEPDADLCARQTAAFDATNLKKRLWDLIAQNYPWPQPINMKPKERTEKEEENLMKYYEGATAEMEKLNASGMDPVEASVKMNEMLTNGQLPGFQSVRHILRPQDYGPGDTDDYRGGNSNLIRAGQLQHWMKKTGSGQTVTRAEMQAVGGFNAAGLLLLQQQREGTAPSSSMHAITQPPLSPPDAPQPLPAPPIHPLDRVGAVFYSESQERAPYIPKPRPAYEPKEPMDVPRFDEPPAPPSQEVLFAWSPSPEPLARQASPAPQTVASSSKLPAPAPVAASIDEYDFMIDDDWLKAPSPSPPGVQPVSSSRRPVTPPSQRASTPARPASPLTPRDMNRPPPRSPEAQSKGKQASSASYNEYDDMILDEDEWLKPPSPPPVKAARAKSSVTVSRNGPRTPATKPTKPASEAATRPTSQTSLKAHISTSSPAPHIHTGTQPTPRRVTSQPRSAPAHSQTNVKAKSAQASATPVAPAVAMPAPTPPPAQVAGTKRRLGMGRPTTGYTNKKFKVFKPPGPA